MLLYFVAYFKSNFHLFQEQQYMSEMHWNEGKLKFGKFDLRFKRINFNVWLIFGIRPRWKVLTLNMETVGFTETL
jgi:hypothetical protein